MSLSLSSWILNLWVTFWFDTINHSTKMPNRIWHYFAEDCSYTKIIEFSMFYSSIVCRFCIIISTEEKHYVFSKIVKIIKNYANLIYTTKYKNTLALIRSFKLTSVYSSLAYYTSKCASKQFYYPLLKQQKFTNLALDIILKLQK